MRVTALPSIILGVNVTTVTIFSQENVIQSNYADNTLPNADVCVQYDTSTIVTYTCVFAVTALPAAMRYILKAESDDRRGQGENYIA